MISGKFNQSEDGFLLLDSLATLTIIMTIILFLNPLMTDWLVQRQQAKDLVEENRLIYEESMEENSQEREYSNNKARFLQIEDYSQKSKGAETGVLIYERNFEYE